MCIKILKLGFIFFMTHLPHIVRATKRLSSVGWAWCAWCEWNVPVRLPERRRAGESCHRRARRPDAAGHPAIDPRGLAPSGSPRIPSSVRDRQIQPRDFATASSTLPRSGPNPPRPNRQISDRILCKRKIQFHVVVRASRFSISILSSPILHSYFSSAFFYLPFFIRIFLSAISRIHFFTFIFLQ